MNRLRLIIGFWLCFWLFGPLVTVAASPDIRFHQLSRQEGLSQSFVLTAAQDQQGFMWFGTQGGLNRFDGYEVKRFTRGEGASALPDNTIRDLLVDSEGRLWIGTENGGLSQYHFDSESFTTFNSQNSKLVTNRIRVLYEDTAGQIWVGTDGAGLWRFFPETGDFFQALKGSTLSVLSLSERQEGGLWLGSNDGLFLYENGVGIYPAFSKTAFGAQIQAEPVRSLLSVEGGRLWVGTESKGAYLVDASGEFFQFDTTSPLDRRISGQQVSKVMKDDRGEIWLATSGGLNHLSTLGVRSYRRDPANPFSLSNDLVYDVFQDAGGVMWIATFGGVSYWSRSEYVAEHITASQRQANALSSPAVTAFAESSDQTIWVGTFGGGLNEISVDGSIRHYRAGEGASLSPEGRLPEDSVMSLYVDSRDRLWVGTRASGLLLFDAEQGVVQQLNQGNQAPYQLSSNAITSITESKYGELLVGTYGGGLNRVNLDTFTVRSVQSGPSPGDLQSNRIMAVHEDQEGHIWLGTDGGGLAYYDRYQEKFTHFVRNEDTGFTGDLVFSIAEFGNGDLYFGTSGAGLFHLRAEDKTVDKFRFTQISEDDGLSSNSIYGLLIDNANMLWLSSNAGLSRLDMAGGVYHLGLGNGLQDLEFNSGAALKLSNGDLLFGGIRGFNRIEPARVEKNPHAPPVVITSVSKQGVLLAPTLAAETGVELTHRDYFLEFRFAGLDFANSMGNQYRYRLNGLDNEWIEAGTRRYVSYTNLKPGNYVFEVLAANSDGVWGDQPAQMSVFVSPAPWLSWWAYVCYTGLVFIIGLLSIRAFRIRRMYVAEIQAVNQRLLDEVETRKEKEAEIWSEREKTQRHLDVAEVALIALDVEGTVLQFNEKAENTFVKEGKPFVGSNLLEYVDIRQRNDLRQKILSVFDGEDDGTHLECRVSVKDGKQRILIWRFAPLSVTGGHANMILASGTDITELRSLEKSVRFREKLSSLGTLSAGIAHDFNNILTAITGYSSLALDKVRGQGEVEEFIRNIEQASTRAAELVARIVSVTQIDEGQFKSLDVNNVLVETVGLLKGSLARDIQLSVNHPVQPVWINGDATQIQQMLMNLGTNAALAMKEQAGKLSFELELAQLAAGEVPLGSTLAPGQYAVLDVVDTGRGMPEAMKQKIFDPFYSSDGLGFGDRPGTGLGLSIVHGIVLAHRGYIDVDSEVDRGTRFRIYFPIAEESSSGTVVQLRPPKVNKRRIMLVDDEEWVVDVTARLLTTLGFEVESFTQPYEALDRFKSSPKDFALVITDQNMPQIKGTELIEGLRKVNSQIKVLMMSGNVSPLLDENHITAFMGKPFKLESLQSALSHLRVDADDRTDDSLNPKADS